MNMFLNTANAVQTQVTLVVVLVVSVLVLVGEAALLV